MDFWTSLLTGNIIVAAGGLWQGIKNGLSWFLEWLFEITLSLGIPSYILAIFIFTLIIKLLLQPLMNKQMRSSRRIQLLAPELAEIKKRYATNQQKMNQATMDLYRDNNCSPTAGCLPMLIQFPILIALYQAIREFVPAYPEYFTIANWFGQTLSLSDPDPTRWVLPLLAAGSTFLQQFISTTNKQDSTQRTMLIMMPIMFFFFVRGFGDGTIGFPSLLAFYWIFYSLIGAAIYWPFLKKWEKEDKIKAEELRLAREAEEEAKRKKKEAAREAARKRSEEYHKKNANKNTVLSKEVVDTQDFFAVLDEAIEEDQDPEIAFRIWLRDQDVTICKKKIKLHPYSETEDLVYMCKMPDGNEYLVDEMRKKYNLSQQTPPDLGALFGVKKNKKKNNEQKEQENK